MVPSVEPPSGGSPAPSNRVNGISPALADRADHVPEPLQQTEANEGTRVSKRKKEGSTAVGRKRKRGDEEGVASMGVKKSKAGGPDIPADSVVGKALRPGSVAGRAKAKLRMTKAPVPSRPITTSTSPMKAAPTSSEKVPVWFTSARSLLRSKDLGETWTQVLGLWEEFERSHDFVEVMKLPSAHRPPCVSEWLKRARVATYRPRTKEGERFTDVKFAQEFGEWWKTLQPDWRLEEDGSLSCGTGDWSILERPGLNGFLSVLAALFFWGDSVEVGSSSSWSRWVEDVRLVLSYMVDNSKMD